MRQDRGEPDQRRSAEPLAEPGGSVSGPVLFDAVLLDRDGTLVEDVPYNSDPDKVRPVPGARVALDRLRAAGLKLAVVTNQSGLARGLFTERQLHRVHRRIEALLGPFDCWQVCPHDDGDGCACRKPRPGLVHAAARALGTVPTRCALIGDIGRDVTAALAAGATGILVPRRPAGGAALWPPGRAAADLLPGVDEVIEHRLPWIDPAPAPVDPQEMAALVTRLAAVAADEAVIFTSFHQSPLPLALLLRMAGSPGSRRSATTTRAACWTCGTGCRSACRRRSGPSRWPLPPVTCSARATNHTCGCARSHRPHPRRVRRVTWCCIPGRRHRRGVPARGGRADRRRVERRRVPGGGDRRPTERDLTARVAGRHCRDLGDRGRAAAVVSVTPGRRTWRRLRRAGGQPPSPPPSPSGSGDRGGCRRYASATPPPPAATPGPPVSGTRAPLPQRHPAGPRCGCWACRRTGCQPARGPRAAPEVVTVGGGSGR